MTSSNDRIEEVMDREIQELRRRLAGILDLAAKHNLRTDDIHAIVNGAYTREHKTGALSDALRMLHEQAEQLSRESEEDIFDSEIKLWEERHARTHEVQCQARHETKFVFPFAAVRQEAVGHGGFHTGVLGFTRPLFRWAYDCGSWRKRTTLDLRIRELLKRSRREADQADLDVLFISHFDADHVNGLERLFAGNDGVPAKVRIVVAPYLGPLNSLVVIARELQREKGGSNLVSAVSDPASYFQSKGVETLILIRPDEPPPHPLEGTSVAPPLPPTPPSPGVDAPIGLEFFRKDGKRYAIDPANIDGGINVVVADPGSFFEVSARGRWLNWIFVPHAHEWEPNYKRVADQARRLFGIDPGDPRFQRELIDQLRTKVGLRQVKKIYAGLNSNATSLSLYAGPRPPCPERQVFTDPSRPPGWLLTGDAPLNKLDAFRAWNHSFAPLASSVGRLMLPHHGAERNFNVELARFASNGSMFLTVDREDYLRAKRPPRTVREKLGRNFMAVTERRGILEVSGEERGASLLPEISHW
jgi:hypothetical protein